MSASEFVSRPTRFVGGIIGAVVNAYGLIAEPRAIRLIQFVIYGGLGYAAVAIALNTPRSFDDLISPHAVYAMCGFLFLGSTLGLFAVLPGIWWLERCGIIGILTGLLMYLVLATAIGSSVIGIVVIFLFAATFVQRFLEIRGSQLAPKRA